MKKILIVEDEAKIRKIIKSYLKEEYYIAEADSGTKALKIFKNDNFDLIILDLMLPELSGEKVCKKIRQISEIPIIMLTAKSSEKDKIDGFNYGADDYLTKPFSPRELLMRVKAILRRSNHSNMANIISLNDGEYKIFPEKLIVEKNNKNCELTTTEFKVLMALIRNSGQVLSREQIADIVMGLEFNGFDRTIDAHIKNIRKKMKLAKDQYVVTVYGAGYKFIGDI